MKDDKVSQSCVFHPVDNPPPPPHPKQKRGNKQKNAHLNFEIQFLKQTPGIRWRTEITTILLLYNLI